MALVLRHAYVREHEDGNRGIHADSTDAEILEYTSGYSVNGQFPKVPPRYWVVCIKKGGDQARLWSVVENQGEAENDGGLRLLDISETDHMSDLRKRLVVGWRSPRTWWIRGVTAATYPFVGITDAEPVPFPGFDRLALSHMRVENLYRTIELNPGQRERIEQIVLMKLHRQQTGNDERLRQITVEARTVEMNQAKLLEAHYADAVPRELFLTHQRRLNAEQASLSSERTKLKAENTEIRQRLCDALDLL